MKFDLHTHTHYSDGLVSPRELLLMAKSKGINKIAITDHDTYYHVPSMRKLAAQLGIDLVNGIELSCYNFKNNKKVHIVGIFLNDNAPNCERLGNQVLDGRNSYHKKMITEINQLGFDISFEEAQAFSKSNTVFKMHLFQAIKSKYPDIDKDFYMKHFVKVDTSDIDIQMNYSSVQDGINAIIQDGGIPVLAHPQLYDSIPDIEEYIGYGLQAIEVDHPMMSIDDKVEAHNIANKYKLMVSGGSDFHFESNEVTLGEFGITEREFEVLKHSLI